MDLQTNPPPILTACLACGWVHGYPWRCAESTAKCDCIFHVGKANTFLLTPNDWSTLSNGTVDGTPTGLHRYVGENRFVFVLLNVTDGNGNVVSHDLETRESDGKYRDASANALHACADGPVVPATGRFGLGVSLSGAGTDLYSCIQGYATKLNAITQSMTVSFWIRPDVDYATGSGWHWSFGRKDLWRFGSYGTGLRLEVFNPSGVSYPLVNSSTPMYAGRWYHLVAVVQHQEGVGGLTWSILSMYVNGGLVASCGCGPGAVKTGSTFLYLGWDEASGSSAGRFTGTVDEFQLYTTVLSQDAIRGLRWFLGGANNVLLPRGVFFDSKLFANLNNSVQMTSGPLAGATVYGNDNKGTASLNSRVIQMVITKNATLAQAWKIVDLAATNSTGNVTAFALMVTNEFYTLGLAKEVRDLTANTVVENSGNFTAPPPPPEWWEKAWNSVVGFGQWLWNGVVAVAVFFVSVGNWLAAALVGIVYSLVSAAWTYFQQNVLEPLRKAIEAFVKFIVDLVVGLIRILFEPLIGAYNSMIRGIQAALTFARQAALTAAVGALWGAVFLSMFGILLIAGFVGLTIIMKWTEILGVGKIPGLIVNVIVAIFVVVQLANAIFDLTLGEIIPGGFDSAVDWSYTLADFILASALAVAGALRVWKTFDEAVANLFGSALALIFLSVAYAANTGGSTPAALLVAILADGAALAVVWLGEKIGLGYRLTPNVGIFKNHSLLAPLARALDFYAKATTVSSLGADLVKYWRVAGS